MNQPIKWRALGSTTWNDDNAVLVDGLSGNLAINTDKGYVTTDRNGSNRYSPTMSAWEGNYELDDKLPLVHITPQVVTYALEIQER